MKNPFFILAGTLLLAGMLASGCATTPSNSSLPTGITTSKEAADLAFHYRQQAAELNALAQRLEFEAEWYAQQSGQDSEQAKRARQMAKDMRATAKEAEELARQYRSQVPHNQVY